MPTIEIVSVKSNGLLLNQEDFEVAIIEENKLESHRGLFFSFLINQKGTIIHIGNPDLKDDKEEGYFGGKILNWDFDSETNFQFIEEYKEDLKKILAVAIEKSPVNQAYFLTDYQFGPKVEDFRKINGFKEFWCQHDKNGLKLNTLYEIKEA